MKSRCLVLALAVVFAQSFPAVGQNTASIQGTIVDSATGKPVPGAIIMASLPSALSKTPAPATRKTATSTYDGSFQIPNLPAGTYSLCVQFPSDGYIGTCQWGAAAPSVALTAAQKSTGITIKVKASSPVQIHVNDPQQLLNQKTKDGYYPDLVMGVWSGSMFYPAHVTNKASTSVDYQVGVPFDTSLKFTIQSRRLQLGDANQKPLASNADQQPFQHASNAVTPAGYTYSVLSLLIP